MPLVEQTKADRFPRIAVLSGKGGAGKTFVAVNLAAVIPRSLYVDCDVEEPDGSLFFEPTGETTAPVEVAHPIFDAERCTGCRMCVDFCAFNALAFVCNAPMLFAETCHSCGGCAKLCPSGAIAEAGAHVGETVCGTAADVRTLIGRIDVGIASGVPVVGALRRQEAAIGASAAVRDCPPGNGCLVMEALKGADFALLVAEPTLFGAQNLALCHSLARHRGLPCGAVLNKCTEGIENPSEQYCRKKGIPILARIPFDRETGRLNGMGIIVSREVPAYRALFKALHGRISAAMAQRTPEEVKA